MLSLCNLTTKGGGIMSSKTVIKQCKTCGGHGEKSDECYNPASPHYLKPVEDTHTCYGWGEKEIVSDENS